MAEQHWGTDSIKGLSMEKGPSASQVIAVITLFPLGGFLLVLAGLTLTGTIIGLAVSTPLFVLFSPVLVPATAVIALSVAGFFASGAFGITALSSLSWIVSYLRGRRASGAEDQMDQAKRRVQETSSPLGQRARDVGQAVQSKAHEAMKTLGMSS